MNLPRLSDIATKTVITIDDDQRLKDIVKAMHEAKKAGRNQVVLA